MLISTAQLLDSNIRNNVCTPAKLPLEENWSLAAVARELHCSKTCIFNIKRRWQENRLERPIRIGVGKVSLLKFAFTLIIHILITSQSHFY
jgi:hypothetical protein